MHPVATVGLKAQNLSSEWNLQFSPKPTTLTQSAKYESSLLDFTQLDQRSNGILTCKVFDSFVFKEVNKRSHPKSETW